MIGLNFTQTTYKVTPRWKIDRIFWRKHWTPFVRKTRNIWQIKMSPSGFHVGSLLVHPGPVKELSTARVYYIYQDQNYTILYLTVPFTQTGEIWSGVLYCIGLRGKLARRRIFKGKKL